MSEHQRPGISLRALGYGCLFSLPFWLVVVGVIVWVKVT